jgi:ankyrin repeat protein
MMASVSVLNLKNAGTALHVAVSQGNQEIVELLLRYKANSSLEDEVIA